MRQLQERDLEGRRRIAGLVCGRRPAGGLTGWCNVRNVRAVCARQRADPVRFRFDQRAVDPRQRVCIGRRQTFEARADFQAETRRSRSNAERCTAERRERSDLEHAVARCDGNAGISDGDHGSRWLDRREIANLGGRHDD